MNGATTTAYIQMGCQNDLMLQTIFQSTARGHTLL